MKVPVGQSLGQPCRVHGKAGKGDAVGGVGVHGGQKVGLRRAEGVADVNNLVESSADGWKISAAKHHGDVVEGGDLCWSLDNIKRVTVRAVTDAEAIDGDGVKAMGKRNINVGVVVVVVG